MIECDSISVVKARNDKSRQIYSRSDFFKGELLINIDNEKITFQKPPQCYEGKVRKVTVSRSKAYYIAVVCEIPFGRFYFDAEESNEDLKVVYYK